MASERKLFSGFDYPHHCKATVEHTETVVAKSPYQLCWVEATVVRDLFDHLPQLARLSSGFAHIQQLQAIS